MYTEEHGSDETISGRGRLRCGSISVCRRLSAVWLSAALLFSNPALSFMFADGEAIARNQSAQTGQFIDQLKDPKFIAEGAQLFAPNCSSGYCHGAGGIGGGAPRLRGKDLEAKYLFKTISSGISGTAMLSFKSDFSEEQIWKRVAFILSDA